MGKKQPKFNFNLSDALGGIDLSQDPAVQKAQYVQEKRASQDTLSSTSVTLPTVDFLQYDKEVYDSYLKPGQYYGSPDQLDYRVAENQSAPRQLLNGMLRLLPLTASKLAGQVNAVKQAAEYAMGDKDVFLDDEMASSINQFEQYIKDSMPIYATEKYNEGSLLEQMGTAKFWADDFGDGVAFLAGQMIGTKGFGAGTNALSKGARFLAPGLKAGELLSKVPGAAKIASVVSQNATAVGAGVMSAGFSGALQAQDTATQIREGLSGKINPQTNTTYTEEEINAIASEKAANTFNATFAAHILPGIWESKIFLGLNKANLGELKKNVINAVNKGEITVPELLAGTGSEVLSKNAFKQLAKGVAEGALIEGVLEENIEQAIQNYEVQTGLNNQNVGTGERIANYAMNMLKNFGTKEDAKAIVLGALLGGPMGGFKNFQQAKDFNEKMPKFLDTLRASDSLYQKDINSIYKTYENDIKDSEGNITHKKGSIILDQNNEPIEDPQKLTNLTLQLINQKKLTDRQNVAIISGNNDMVTLNENMALSAAVYRELATAMDDGNTDGALEFLKWRVKKVLEEQEAEKDATDAQTLNVEETPEGRIEAGQAETEGKAASARFNGKDRTEVLKAISNSIKRIEEFGEMFKNADSQARNLAKIGQSAARSNFNSVVQKALFYEAVKRNSYDSMIDERKELLKDPINDTEKITEEINMFTRLRDESIQRSKGYLTDTENIYKQWAGPQEKYGTLLGEANKIKTENNSDIADDQTNRKLSTLTYQLNEINNIEGLGIENGPPVFNEEISTVNPSARTSKPAGSRNALLWNAAKDYTAAEEISNKLKAYNEDSLSLEELAKFTDETTTHIDSATAKGLNGAITAERDKLASVTDKIANTEASIWTEDQYGNDQFITNPDFIELKKRQEGIQRGIDEAERVLSDKQKAEEIDLLNNQPENIEKHLIKQNALSYFDKGRYVVKNALDEDGNVREDYFDRRGVNDAIADLVQMRDAMEDRTAEGGDLFGVKGLSFLIRDANRMLEQLYRIRTQAELQQNNRLGRQKKINRDEAKNLVAAMGFSDGAITNSDLFNTINTILNGTLQGSITQIENLQERHYEAVSALIHKIQSAATPGQLGELDKKLELSMDLASAQVKELLGTKGVNGSIVRSFSTNPRQGFMSGWSNLSQIYINSGYSRINNDKGSLFNQFKKNNDIEELIATAEQLSDDTQEFGMPKDTFLKLAYAFRQSLYAEKLKTNLSLKLKPTVKNELKYVEEQSIVPTTQQEIAIREGLSWLQQPNKGTSPYTGWAFLRGTAGTGKTSVVLKWLLDNSGIDKSRIIVTALTSTATQVAAESTGTDSAIFDAIESNEIPAGKDLLIIDEYGTIGEDRLSQFEKKLRESGSNIKVLLLGDPTQITPNLQSNMDVNNLIANSNATNIKVIEPLTIVYRSDISAVNEISGIFQDNSKAVEDITVRADRPISSPLAKGVHTSTAASLIPQIIERNIKNEQDNGYTPRTRAIIVENENDVAKYGGLGADVMTVYNAQSRTYDEVYVDIPRTNFSETPRYNTAMYTAISRAKEYAFVTYPKGENITDSSLGTEFTNNRDQIKDAKTQYIQDRTAELAMMEGLDNGKTIKEINKDKSTKENINNAGKTDLDIAEEVSETREEPEIIAETPSISDESDIQIDDTPDGPIDPETEAPAPEPVQLPTLFGQRQVIDNSDSEAYPALRDGLIGANDRNKVVYLYTKEENRESSISVIALGNNNQWVTIGKIFQEQILKDDKYSDIRDKIGSMKPFYTTDISELNGRRRNDEPYTIDELAANTVRTGTIGASNYLRFNYSQEVSASPKDISQIFKEQFYYKSQADKANSIRYKIFTISEIDPEDYDGTFRPIPGLPYAIIGAKGDSYKGAMFVRLQANRIDKNDDRIEAIRLLANSVEKVQNYTGILMGTKSFNDLVRVFRNSLEIVNEPTPGGTVPKVQAKSSFTRADVTAYMQDMLDRDGRDGDVDILSTVSDEMWPEVIGELQNMSMMLYGIKNKEAKYTQAEIDAMGEEWVAVPLNKKQERKGEELFYAKLKDEDGRKYKRQDSLSIDNGRAQLAFDQIARANEFVGGTRIRVEQHLGRDSRKQSYTGKSLISSEGGSSRVYELMQLMAVNVTGPELVSSGKLTEEDFSTTEGLKAAISEVRDQVNNSGQDPIIYLQSKLKEIGDDAISSQVDKIIRKKETPPVNLATLQLIASDENFDDKNQHMTSSRYPISDRRGNTSSRQTFLRVPLNIDKFNDLGSDPLANENELSKLVNSTFSSITPTRIEVDFEGTAVSEDIVSEENSTEFHQDIDNQIAALKKQKAATKDIKERLEISKKIIELENSRGRMPFDSSQDKPDPGKRINVKQALEDIKRFIPNITEDELFFVNKTILSRLANPGEDLLGLYDKGKIYLETTDEGVYDKVLRHEVMHKIFNEYLSNSERKALRRELDPERTLTVEQFDELVADTFMDWQRGDSNLTFTDKAKKIFQKILNWFGFYFSNKSAIETIFSNIEEGRYTKATSRLSDVRRGFSNIKKTFGNVQNYRYAVELVQGQIKDSVLLNDLDSAPITMKEAKVFIKDILLNKKSILEPEIVELEEAIEYLKEHEEDAQLLEETQERLTDLKVQVGILKSIFSTSKSYDTLWKDLYPNYSFKDGDVVSPFEEFTEEYTEEDSLNDSQISEDATASTLADFTVKAEERNQEGKVSENVKNFLSFVFRKNGTRIPPRYAYLESLRTLAGLVSSQGNLKEQILEAAAYNGIDMKGKSDGKTIVNHILNLIDDATSSTYVDHKGNTATLPSNIKFLDENNFYIAEEGANIADISYQDVIKNLDQNTIFSRREKETTPQFLRRIYASEILDKRTINALFKQMQAQETLREVMSNFLSQRESTPMIAEETRTFKNGQSVTLLRYFRAQMHGAERVMSSDIENAIKENWLKLSNKWDSFNAAKTDKDKVTIVLEGLGIQHKGELNPALLPNIVENFKAFKFIIDEAYSGGSPKPIKYDEEDQYEAEQESVQLADVEYLLSKESGMINNLTRLLTRNSTDARPAKYVSVDGRNRYTFFNSNQAIENVNKVIANTGIHRKFKTELPKHLQDTWGKMNIFVSGANTIHELTDHDGMRREKGEEFAKGYSDETDKDNLQRQFAYAFLTYIKANTGKSDKNLKYIQYFYTISNRPRMIGAEINVLRPSELRAAAKDMLLQHLAQPETSKIANYDKYKTINMELLGDAITETVGPRNAENYTKIKEKEIESILDKFDQKLKDLASTVADKLISEKVLIGDDAGKVATLMRERSRNYLDKDAESIPQMISQGRDNLGYTKEQLLPLVEQWVKNNYINSYFLNQIPVGNFNYFKSALDLVKRMSGVFAPGIKGLVGKDFMSEKFTLAVMEDPKMFSDELSEIFRDMNTALYRDVKNDLGKPNLLGERKEKGFDLADAQGFMLPSRADNIIKGFGKSYNAGAVFKPAHYEVVDKDGDYIPVMIKYSSVVLSDDLVMKYPKLKALRDAMESQGVDEVVFDSANKVGGSTEKRPVPKLNDFGANTFVFPESSIRILSNENFRLQLNPKHDTFSNVANPTQLGYFLNVLGKINPRAGAINDPAATEVYTAIGNLISHGLSKITKGLTPKGKVSKKQIMETLTGAGNERIAEMLQDLSYNMPNIADKALIQIMNLFSKKTVKIKFKGGKFVLQSAYGIEMIKPGSERYNSLSEQQRIAHDSSWSAYGQKEREKIADQARSLKYGKDEKGRMYAEVILDKSFADKVKAGDFLLPDAMGYRVPSTELHSSVAIKVVGFYDSKGSNVIIAPPELVKQHGSDFDVDSLYVIGREVYNGAIPELGLFDQSFTPGYEWSPSAEAFVFNKNNWEKKFPKWYNQAGNNTSLIRKIDKLYEMFQRNIIVENFLNVISHPENILRMTEPISVQVITDTLKELGLNTEKRIDLSSPLDNLEVYNSNFQGAKLVGTFANGMKALAYMLKAGPNGNYPTLNGDPLELDGVAYGEFKEQYPDGRTIWQVLDALVNTAVDNVKEQQLYKINATDATGNMYVAAQALGIPLNTSVSLMLQPIGLLHTKMEGRIPNVKAELLSAYNKITKSPLESYKDLAALATSMEAPKLSTSLRKTVDTLSEIELLKQVQLMKTYENLYNIGQDIKLFSSSVGVVQDLPVMYEDIQKRADGWDKMGSVDSEGNFKTNEDFSWNLDNLFTAQPNIREAYKVFQIAKFTAETSLTKHLPAVRAFVDELVKESGVKLSYKQNVEDMKNELISYLVSSVYSLENKLEAPYEYMYKNVQRIATGKQAWSQRFISRLEKERKGTDNKFLKKIGINNRYGLKTITFSTSSNSDYMDNLEAQEEFEKMSYGTKMDFVKYAVLNFGLKFGVKNYSMFIPAPYLKFIDDHLSNLDKQLRNIGINEDGKVEKGLLTNIKDNFLLRLAVNNVEKLPYIPKRVASAIQTEGKYITIMEPTGPKQIPSLSGFDEFYYNRKYANPMDGDKRSIASDKFPQFIKTNDNTVMMRLNDPDNDFVYYQRVGGKNWIGGYDASTEALTGKYDIDKYFGRNLIPVPVGDINAEEFQVNNDYIVPGSSVIVYGYNNESRDQGRIAVVDKVKPDLVNPSKKTITIRDIESEQISPEQELIFKKVSPFINSIRERFNLPVVLTNNATVGNSNKGVIKNGIVMLNIDTLTLDTPFHEVSHPLIEAIMKKNPKWFNNLVTELENNPRGVEIYLQVDRAYPELDDMGKTTEALVTLLGELAAGNLDREEGLKGHVMRLFRAIGDIIRTILKASGVINIENLSRDEMASLTLNDLSLILADKDANIQLDLSGFVRSNRESKQLNDIEAELIKNGQILLTCKL